MRGYAVLGALALFAVGFAAQAESNFPGGPCGDEIGNYVADTGMLVATVVKVASISGQPEKVEGESHHRIWFEAEPLKGRSVVLPPVLGSLKQVENILKYASLDKAWVVITLYDASDAGALDPEISDYQVQIFLQVQDMCLPVYTDPAPIVPHADVPPYEGLKRTE